MDRKWENRIEKDMNPMSGVFSLQIYSHHISTFINTINQMYAHISMQQHYTLWFPENKVFTFSYDALYKKNQMHIQH